jgi:hypothetical protein
MISSWLSRLYQQRIVWVSSSKCMMQTTKTIFIPFFVCGTLKFSLYNADDILVRVDLGECLNGNMLRDVSLWIFSSFFSCRTSVRRNKAHFFWGQFWKKMLREIYLAYDTVHVVSGRLRDLVREGMESDRIEHGWWSVAG